jgi:hypothetical protein
MTWILPVLTLATAGLLFGSAFFLLRPSQGQVAERYGKPAQARMDERPLRSYYLPLTFLFGSFFLLLPSAASEASLEARLTKLILALFPLLGCGLLLRIRRWPR